MEALHPPELHFRPFRIARLSTLEVVEDIYADRPEKQSQSQKNGRALNTYDPVDHPHSAENKKSAGKQMQFLECKLGERVVRHSRQYPIPALVN